MAGGHGKHVGMGDVAGDTAQTPAQAAGTWQGHGTWPGHGHRQRTWQGHQHRQLGHGTWQGHQCRQPGCSRDMGMGREDAAGTLAQAGNMAGDTRTGRGHRHRQGTGQRHSRDTNVLWRPGRDTEVHRGHGGDTDTGKGTPWQEQGSTWGCGRDTNTRAGGESKAGARRRGWGQSSPCPVVHGGWVAIPQAGQSGPLHALLPLLCVPQHRGIR